MENLRRELVERVKRNLKKGYSEDSLKYALLNQGYSRIEVEEALRIAKRETQPEKEEKKEKPKIRHEYYGSNNKPIREPFFRRLFKKK